MSDFSEDKPNVNEEDVVIPEEEEKVEEMSFKEPETISENAMDLIK